MLALAGDIVELLTPANALNLFCENEDIEIVNIAIRIFFFIDSYSILL